LCATDQHPDVSIFRIEEWLGRGGTAVVLLPNHCSTPAKIAAAALPARQEPPASEAAPSDAPQPDAEVVRGLTPAPRQVTAPQGLHWFVDAGDWQMRARIGDHPFVLERPVGAGRLIVVADATFVTNAVLDHADNALLAIDLVKAYGVPLIDEREHGLRGIDNPLAYLVRSPAALLLLGMLLLGSMYAWAGQLVPPRQLDEVDSAPPTLAAFIDSLASLYRMSRDHGRVAQAYRDYTLARLRRHFGFAHDVSDDAVLQRLRARYPLAAQDWSCLRNPAPARDEVDLRRSAEALDRLAEEVMR
jgi:hypothetical protein